MTDPTPPEVELMADLVSEKSIREEGCLSPLVDVFSRDIQEAQGVWLDVSYSLNRLALDAWQRAVNEGEKTDLAPVANRLLFRAINGFGAAVTLTRRGMDIEAQGLARTVYECAFWLGYMSAEPDVALANFKIDNTRNVQAHHILMGEQGLVAPEEMDHCQRVYDDLKRVKIPSMEKMSEKGGIKPAFQFYKWLCGMAAHSSMASIDRYLEDDINGKIAHSLDFTGRLLPETLGFANTGLMAALTSWQKISRVPFDEDELTRIEAETTLMFVEQERRGPV